MPCGAPSSWRWFSYYVNHSKDNKAANARLMADIDLSSECGSTFGNWIPIASKDSGYVWNAGWTGALYGNHHAIRHLYINSDKDEQGLSGYGWQHPSAAGDGRYLGNGPSVRP